MRGGAGWLRGARARVVGALVFGALAGAVPAAATPGSTPAPAPSPEAGDAPKAAAPADPAGSPDPGAGDVAPADEGDGALSAELAGAGSAAEGDADGAADAAYTVTVRAARARPLTASTTQLTAQDLAAAPRRTAEDALRLVPGFVLVQHGSEGKGHQFFVRGFDALHGADLELRLEGVPINERSNIHAHGYLDLGLILPELIRTVEVTKGPFTLDQGAFALAASADYRLGVPESDRGLRVKTTAGTTQRYRGLVSYSRPGGEGEDFIAAELLHDAGFGQRRGIDRAALLGRLRLVDGARHRWTLLGAAHFARFELPGALRDADVQAGRLGFYDAYPGDQHGRSARGLLSLSHRWLGARAVVSSQLYAGARHLALLENFTGDLVDPVHGDRRQQRQTTYRAGLSADAQLRLSGVLGLEAGLGIHGEQLDQRQRHVDGQGAALQTERALRGAQGRAHVKLGVRLRPLDALRLAAGLRLDLAQVHARDRLAHRPVRGARVAVSPRATLQWRVSPPLRLFAAYGRGFRPPEARAFSAHKPHRTGISDDLYQGGDPDMTTADAFELGARWTPSRWFGGAISGFGTWIAREMVFDHVSGVNLELNRTRRLGVELQVHSNPAPWLRLSADLSYVDARFVRSGRPIPLAPSLVSGLRAVLHHPSGLQAGLRMLGLSPRPLPHGAEGAPLLSLDATAGYRWRWLRVELELENLLNRHTREGEYHYASHWRPGTPPSQLPVLHTVAGPPRGARLSLSAVF